MIQTHNMKESEKAQVMGISFEPEVLRALDKRAEQLERPRSWLVNKALRAMLDMPDAELMPGREQ